MDYHEIMTQNEISKAAREIEPHIRIAELEAKNARLEAAFMQFVTQTKKREAEFEKRILALEGQNPTP